MRALIAAFRFLTRIPMPGRPTEAAEIGAALGWFPLVGAVVGLALAGAFAGFCRLWNPWTAGVLAIAFGLMLTGGFHEDGATDATDGLGGGWTRERVLEIMKDSRIGAYGAMTLWCLLAFRLVALVALGPKTALVALPFAMAWGRFSVAPTLRLLPPIGQGLAKEIHKGIALPLLLQALVLAALAAWGAWMLHLPRVLPAVAAGLAANGLWILYLRRRLGGHSGDLLGAGTQVVEAAVLLVLLAR